jgi:hypothetical protein
MMTLNTWIHKPKDLAIWASFLFPACLWIAFALASKPFMYPGLDVWIHIGTMLNEGRRQDTWHLMWGGIFDALSTVDPFIQAKLVHTTQILILGFLLYVAARWLLMLTFAKNSITPAQMNLAAWLAVLVWVLMHGTVSSPIGSVFRIWFGWLQWYSVNYQLALPLYVFSISALLFGLFGHRVQPMQTTTKWGYVLVATLATLCIAVLHAAELPYVMFAVLLIGFVWFNGAWWRYYILGFMALIGLIALVLEISHRLPTGLEVLIKKGPAALIAQIESNGMLMVNGLNRGNASWNYWYWVGLALGCAAFLIIWRQNSNPSDRNHSLRMVALVLGTALPAAMLHFKWTAGVLAMLTYPDLAWRFTFSSFLFIGPSLVLLALAVKWPHLGRLWVQMWLAGGLVLAVLLASRQTEVDRVSYQYARGVALSLSSQHMRFGLEPHQAAWLDDVHNQLLTNPPEQLLCTDMFTAYYLFFVKGYQNVVLPSRISMFIDHRRREGDCKFPRSGGEHVQLMNVGPLPWNF